MWDSSDKRMARPFVFAFLIVAVVLIAGYYHQNVDFLSYEVKMPFTYGEFLYMLAAVSIFLGFMSWIVDLIVDRLSILSEKWSIFAIVNRSMPKKVKK